MATKYISKSSYMAGLTCKRKLWLRLWDSKAAAEPNGMSVLAMEMGNRFGSLARELYPTGRLIDIDVFNLEKAVADTKAALDDGEAILFEAAFQTSRCRILADIVEKNSDGSWHLIEVKTSAKVKPEHVNDLAYQKYVMENAGYPVTRCSVIHADKGGAWPDKASIFEISDQTREVNAALGAVANNAAAMLALSEDTPPDAKSCYSKACRKCEFQKTSCWEGIEDFTIYDVVHATKISKLESERILYVRDIPTDYELSKRDRKTVNRIQKRGVDIDKEQIAKALGELEYPLYFLDFESVALPVPKFDVTSPWQKLVFQYSLHIQYQGGEVEHREFLHTESTDPSDALMKSMLEDIGEKGSIIVYYAGMEAGVIKDLARRFPAYRGQLEELLKRIWDLELIFKNHYRDWRFGTQSSIKVVLPALCSGLSYKELDIQEGGSASLAWIRMLESSSQEEKEELEASLKEYCALDTFAMVRLLDAIR